MGKLRKYRRDQERIAKTLLERKDIKNQNDFEKEYEKYMKGSQIDKDFKKGVLETIIKKQGSSFDKTVKVVETFDEKGFDYKFVGKQKNKETIFKARFDKKANRYRNEKGQFVSVILPKSKSEKNLDKKQRSFKSRKVLDKKQRSFKSKKVLGKRTRTSRSRKTIEK